jgi:4-hydroxythreonine-4-phosphate dehydrogenase
VNPHGGEQGLIGREEREIVEPFCQDQGRRPHMQIKGPIPADTLFREAFAGDYDGVVAAYHDQAMIPLKLLGPGRVVNVTWGLPFIRTSPDHGVAYDLAKKGRADPRGMKLAINLAIDLIAAKKTGAHFGSNMLPGKTS